MELVVIFTINKTLLKNVEDSEELMECIRDDTFIYVRSSKYFKIAWKKNTWKEITSALGIDIVPAQTRYNSVRTNFIKQVRST